MNLTPLTPEEHTFLADTAQLEGNVCALISLGMLVCGLGWTLGGRWEGIPASLLGAWLLTIANTSFARADQHRSAAAACREAQ